MSAAVRKKKYNVRDSFKLQRTEVESTNHCCVPHCSASGLYNSHLSFHRFLVEIEMEIGSVIL